jgi:metal-responsive CopG/Arc/MetJ family transcriptional regulator
MFKTVTVTFRTRREMLEWLDQCSRESKCSRSSLIEMVLSGYLADRMEKRGHLDVKQDMRKKTAVLTTSIENQDYASVILGGFA